MCLFLDPDDVASKIKLNATVDNLLEKYGVPRKDKQQDQPPQAPPAAKPAQVAQVANPPPPPPAAKPGRKAGKKAAMAEDGSKGAQVYGRTRSGH